MSSDSMSIMEEKIGERGVKLRVRGQINSVTAEKLKKKLNDIIYDKNNYVIINMSGVSFLSSGGIRVLLMYYKIMKGNGGKFFIQDPSDNVKNVLGMVALDEMLYR